MAGEHIFMSVPRVPWHCEHNVDREKCQECNTDEK